MAITKPKLLTIKVSEEEKKEWHKKASSFGVPLSRLIRDFMSDVELPKQNKIKPKPVPVADPKLLFQISAIGNNMNQISRRVNEGERFDVVLELSAIEEKLEKILNAHKIH